MWRDVGHELNLNKKGVRAKEKPIFLFFRHERKRGRKRPRFHSTIYGIPSVGIRQAKNDSSSHRCGLRVGIENMRFLRESKQGVQEIKGFRFRKRPRGFMRFILRSKR